MMIKKTISIPLLRLLAPAALTVLMLAPSSAQAQCEQSSSAQQAMQQAAQSATNDLNDYISELKNFINLDQGETASYEVLARLEEFDVNIRGWLSDWWDNRLLPSLEEMTKQNSIATIDQSRQLGTMMDSAAQNMAQKRKQALETSSRQRYQPNELSCQLDNAGPAQTKTFQTARALNRGLSRDRQRVQLNAKGTPAATGRAAEIRSDWDEYIEKFCDPAAGDLGCTTAGTRPGQHKDLPNLLWGDKQSIDLSDPDNQVLLQASLRYALAPAAPNPIPAAALNSPAGRQEMMSRRAEIARRNAVYNTVAQMLSERVSVPAPTETAPLATFFRNLRKSAGHPDSAINSNPSYSELRTATTRDRFTDVGYITRIVNTPEEVIREQGAVNAIRLQLMNDLYRRQEEMVFMEAAGFARDLDNQLPSTAIESSPLRH